MNLIAVLGWQDGFGADTYVYGIFDSIEKARKVVPHTLYDDTEPRWVSIPLNEEALHLDWYEATPLFPTKRKRKVKNF